MKDEINYSVTKDDLRKLHLQSPSCKRVYIYGIILIIFGLSLFIFEALNFCITLVQSNLMDLETIIWILFSLFSIIWGMQSILIIYRRYKNYIQLKNDYPDFFEVKLTINNEELIYESDNGENRFMVKKILIKNFKVTKDFIFIITKANSSLFIVKKYLSKDKIDKILLLKS